MKILRSTNRCFDAEGCHPDITITYVLTGGGLYQAGYPGDLAVYAGIGSPAWVAHHGTKLIYREAVAYFPDLTEDQYRD